MYLMTNLALPGQITCHDMACLSSQVLEYTLAGTNGNCVILWWCEACQLAAPWIVNAPPPASTSAQLLVTGTVFASPSCGGLSPRKWRPSLAAWCSWRCNATAQSHVSTTGLLRPHAGRASLSAGSLESCWLHKHLNFCTSRWAYTVRTRGILLSYRYTN